MLPELFRTIEDDLQKKVRDGAAPFLSLFVGDILPSTSSRLKELFASSGESIDELEDNFVFFPALTASHLTASLAQNIGDHFKIYPHIEEAFGIDLRNEALKNRLWQSFRRACQHLGLDVSPRTSGPHYMVSEYLRQTGFPLRYTENLVHRCLQLGKRVGFPDPDDPDGLRLWQETLLTDRISGFPKTARRVIELDHTSYYLQEFLEVLDGTKSKDACSQFQQEVVRVLTDKTETESRASRQILIPRVVYRDGVIGALLPQRSDLNWALHIDGEFFSPESSGAFVPFGIDLPQSVKITNSKSTWQWNFDLWEDEKNNRMLLFGGKDGHFISRANFNEEIPVVPGKYILLSRFDPEHPEHETERIQDWPEIFATEINIAPGETEVVSRGPARFTLHADEIPTLRFEGINRIDLNDNELLAGKGLCLNIQLPKNLLNEALVIGLKSRALGEYVEIPIPRQDSDLCSVNLTGCLEQWAPGASQVMAECRRVNSKRILTRTSAFVWNGLDSIDKDGFHCSRKPTNFDAKSSSNFELIEDYGYLHYNIKEPLNSLWTIAFDDGGRSLEFSWARPGLYMRLRTFTESGSTERSLREGSNVSIKASAREILMIFGLGEGKLTLGDQEWPLHSKQKIWKAPLATLAESVTHYSSTLHFTSTLGEEKALIQFVTPQHISSFHYNPTGFSHTVSFSFLTEPTALLIHARNLFSSTAAPTSSYIESPIGRRIVENLSQGGEIEVDSEGTRCNITLSPCKWPSGLWLLDIEAKCQNRWGRLSNKRLDRYCLLIPVNNETFFRPSAEIVMEFSESYDVPPYQLLKELHSLLLHCHAIETWEHIGWTKTLWKSLVFRVEADAKDCSESRQAILKILDEPLPEDSHPGWISLLHPVWENPAILAWPAVKYAALPPENKHLPRCLNMLESLAEPELAFKKGLISIALGMSCDPPPGSMQNFSLSRALLVLQQVDTEDGRKHLWDKEWEPGQGDYLGPLHLRYALQRLKTKRRECELGEGNNRRRSWATMLARGAVRYRLLPMDEIEATRESWDNFLLYGQDSLIEDEREILLGSACFIATYAYLCRLAARTSDKAMTLVNDYLKKLTPNSMNMEQAATGAEYLLATSEELLGFYLMFWELLFQPGSGLIKDMS
jgi:hypothetical protein